MHLEKATSHSSEAGLAGWISSNDVTLFTVVLVVGVAIFLQANVIKGSKENKSLLSLSRKDQEQIRSISKDLSATRDELEATTQRLQVAAADLQDTQRRLQEIQQLLEATKQQLATARQEKDNLEAARTQLDKELLAAMNDVKALNRALDALKVERTNLLTSAETLGRDKMSLTQEKESLTKAKSDLATESANLAAMLKQRLQEVDDLKRARDELNKKASDLDKLVQELQRRLGLDEQKMAELEKSSAAESASLKQQVEAAKLQAKTNLTAWDAKVQAALAKLAETELQAKQSNEYYNNYWKNLWRGRAEEYKLTLEKKLGVLNTQLASTAETLKTTQNQLLQRRSQEKTVKRELVGINGQLKRVAILFDSSGSMSESGRWDEVTRITATWLQHLEFDQCVLIVFSSDVSVFPADGSLLSVTGPQGDANRARLLQYLKAVKPEGWTNTLAAMQTAYRYRDLDTIVLFSDGAPTYANSNKFNSEMAQQIYALCRQHANVPVNTIGLGNYFEQDLSTFLRTVAKLTGGTFLGR
jgi:predicted  nucleic acid-binding Zn-ribbon protein